MTTQSADNDIELRITLKDADGNALDASLGKVGFQAKDSAGRLIEGYSGSDPLNCYVDDSKLVLAIPSNTFLKGYVSVRVKTITENDNFPDLTKDVWGDWIKTDLKIV